MFKVVFSFISAIALAFAFIAPTSVRADALGSAAKGAVVGAVAGAVIGNNVGHRNAGRGAMIGAGAGVVAGLAYDHYTSKRETPKQAQVNTVRPVVVVPQPFVPPCNSGCSSSATYTPPVAHVFMPTLTGN